MRELEQTACLAAIQTNYSNLSKAEKLVADYILSSPDQILHKTISEVAEDLKVANSTVFRFCKTMGFKGYQAMKIALASEISAPIVRVVEEKITEFDNEQQITEKIFNTSIQSFKDTISRMDFSLIKKVVDVMIRADRVEFYGFGMSNLVATDAHYKFIGSGITTAAYTDYYLQRKAASQLTQRDAAVLISDQANSFELNEVITQLKLSGATIIGIFPLSPGNLHNDLDLVMHTSETILGGAEQDGTFSRLIQLSLIDALYINVMTAREGFLKNSIKKLKSYLGKPKIQTEE